MIIPKAAHRDKADTPALLVSGSSFSGSLAIVFSPMGSEYNLASKFPQSEVTLNSITQYQVLMEEMRGEWCLSHVAACARWSQLLPVDNARRNRRSRSSRYYVLRGRWIARRVGDSHANGSH